MQVTLKASKDSALKFLFNAFSLEASRLAKLAAEPGCTVSLSF